MGSAGSWIMHMGRHGGGANAPRGDGGRRRRALQSQIDDLENQLGELRRNQGSRSEKAKIETKIRRLKEEGDRAEKGESHHN